MAQRVMERSAERKGEPRAERRELDNGPTAAAFLAAGIGSLVLGIATTSAAASPAISAALNLYRPAGPLSGKVLVTIIAWLVAWAILHITWRNKQLDFGKIYAATLVLIALGFLGTFPIFFELFAPH